MLPSMLSAWALLIALQGPPVSQIDEPPPRRYGDQGTSHFGLSLGLGSGGGGFAYAAGLEYGYFVLDGVAPGIDTQVGGGTGLLTSGLILGTLRVIPIRTSSISLVLIGRGGRVLLGSGHPDGWGVGGGAGIIFFTGAHLGLQLSYDVLRLMPSSFCSDLASKCTDHGFSIGFVVAF